MPRSAASSRASPMEALREKSTPVTRAPSRAQDSVSRPKWHWRWSRLLSLTSPIAAMHTAGRARPLRGSRPRRRTRPPRAPSSTRPRVAGSRRRKPRGLFRSLKSQLPHEDDVRRPVSGPAERRDPASQLNITVSSREAGVDSPVGQVVRRARRRGQPARGFAGVSPKPSRIDPLNGQRSFVCRAELDASVDEVGGTSRSVAGRPPRRRGRAMSGPSRRSARGRQETGCGRRSWHGPRCRPRSRISCAGPATSSMRVPMSRAPVPGVAQKLGQLGRGYRDRDLPLRALPSSMPPCPRRPR